MICVDKIEETNVETANKIREEIKGIAHSFTCDVTKRDQIDDLHTRVSTEYHGEPETSVLQFRTSSETVNSCSVKIIQEKEVNRKITW